MEAEIDTGRTTGPGEDVTLVDEEDTGIHRQSRIPTSQCIAFCPVGGRSPSVEKTRFGQHEHPGAERQQPAPSGVRPSELLEHSFGNLQGR